MKSKRGVYGDINESTYYIDCLNIRFYFSSNFYVENFKNRIENYINEEIYKLKNKYKINIEAEEVKDIVYDLKRFLAISLYKKIEKRGFRIYFLINK